MTGFSLPLLLGLLAACGLLMVLEFRGLKTTLKLEMKGDVKRETRWLAQYGQAACTAVAALLVLQLDPRPDHKTRALVVLIVVVAASVAAMLVRAPVQPGAARPRERGKISRPHDQARQPPRELPVEPQRRGRGAVGRAARRCTPAAPALLGVGAGVRRPALHPRRPLAQRRVGRHCPGLRRGTPGCGSGT